MEVLKMIIGLEPIYPTRKAIECTSNARCMWFRALDWAIYVGPFANKFASLNAVRPC